MSRMGIAAKALEALGIACVMVGLVEGLLSETMWTELYLSILGIFLFLVGRRLEKRQIRKGQTHEPHSPV